MNNSQSLKDKLLVQLSAVIEELQTIANHDETTDDWVAVPDATELMEADENTEADAVEEWNERRATLSQLETTYRLIKRALNKIEAGTYGICEISGEEIEPERLMINPTARTCTRHMDEERTLPL
jgi:RNA polymerase-binding transcription factor DksA